MIFKFQLNCAETNMWSMQVKHLRTTYITVGLRIYSVVFYVYLHVYSFALVNFTQLSA